ncbi:group II intron reverse transcriptase domain-containing protein [Leptospira sp. 201903071]|uniref:antiviral reverse transcriptase Drt2 n=1 Tax=Leptospira ainazelensis TaxID=2810034 RepID=UPI0019662631|nr:antiviral reverse transcriptase Drt2 [Leptospira ainazelensis]MBM9501701.1 group II intron reverse transcriptase domain-containing protein [Leptospira ainazelensis]
MEAAGPKAYLIFMQNLQKLFKQKSYKHFDSSFPPNKELVTKLENHQFIQTHSFWPFLHFNLKVSRFSAKVKKIKERELYYSSHIDSYIYQFYNQRISQTYEAYLISKKLSNYPIAYRGLGKSNIHFARESFDFLRNNRNSLVLCFDIEKFFDRLDHSILKKNLQKVLNVSHLPSDVYSVFKSITKFSWTERDEALKALGIKPKDLLNKERLCSAKEFRNQIKARSLIHKNRNKFGIPQGTALSALLSNIYMIEFDLQMSKFSAKLNGYYRRYSDDIILIIPCSSQSKDYYNDFVKDQIAKLKLTISDSKTEIIQLKDGVSVSGKPIQYLGFIYADGEVRLRPKTITNYYRKLYKRIEIIKSVQLIKRNKKVFLKKFYSNYTHLGKDNFISYVKRAKNIFQNDSLTKDTKYHWNKIYKRLK